MMVYDSTLRQMFVWDGTAWKRLARYDEGLSRRTGSLSNLPPSRPTRRLHRQTDLWSSLLRWRSPSLGHRQTDCGRVCGGRDDD